MSEAVQLELEIIEEALAYIGKLKTNYMQVEMEYYWQEDRASQLLVNLIEGVEWLKQTFELLVERNGNDYIPEEYIEVQRRGLELLQAMEKKDWLLILDFLRFKFKGYLIFMENAYIKLRFQFRGV
ncbi:hypothetical protein EN829_045100 [Mesorhizobium sp. M00.F.Ca.ET.186.01.1.1]|nr:hypothetical protein EN829_045100 [Mesorhizobium sp. M00.F.Ca.ET.186.01.1.1]